jgi:hypothetical protein
VLFSLQRFDEDLHGQAVFVDELVRVGSEILASCHANAKRTVSYHMTSISARWAQVSACALRVDELLSVF